MFHFGAVEERKRAFDGPMLLLALDVRVVKLPTAIAMEPTVDGVQQSSDMQDAAGEAH
ncbi:MAG: hypothetical protein WBM47_15995 [Polyangiales bacterium]